MVLTALRLRNFRNHPDSALEFGSGTNVLLGNNGEGKTNVLEAISYLCLTRSFYAGGDGAVLHVGSGGFEVEGKFRMDRGTEQTVRVAYDKARSEKAVFVNRRAIEPFSSIIGRFPLVICSPEHAPITMGSPMDRRRFVDFVISQSSSAYFETLLEYRRVVRHRNKLLLDARLSGGLDPSVIQPWSEQLVNAGASLTARRRTFVEEFQPYMREAYTRFSGAGEEPSFDYVQAVGAGGDASPESLREAFHAELRERAHEERKAGTTLVGPHRDEFSCAINGLDLRKYASQGQHKTFLVALKLAEFQYLKERCSEIPVLLLDDIFSELDEKRSSGLLAFVGGVSQTIITSTVQRLFDGVIDAADRNRKFFIEGGSVVRLDGAAVS